MNLFINVTYVIVSRAIKMAVGCRRYSIKFDGDIHLLLMICSIKMKNQSKKKRKNALIIVMEDIIICWHPFDRVFSSTIVFLSGTTYSLI